MFPWLILLLLPSVKFRVNPWQMLLLLLILPSVDNLLLLLPCPPLVTLQELKFYDGLPPSPKIL